MLARHLLPGMPYTYVQYTRKYLSMSQEQYTTSAHCVCIPILCAMSYCKGHNAPMHRSPINTSGQAERGRRRGGGEQMGLSSHLLLSRMSTQSRAHVSTNANMQLQLLQSSACTIAHCTMHMLPVECCAFKFKFHSIPPTGVESMR